MKFMLALCLLGMAMDATTASTEPSICREGLEAYNAFRECVWQYLPDRSKLYRNPERDTINDFLTQLCGPTLDNARRCFISQISHCDGTAQSMLTSIVGESGMFCDHGGPSINPAALYLVALVEWSGLTDKSCPHPDIFVCYQEASEAMMEGGLNYTLLSQLPMEQLSLPLTSYFRADMTCVVRLHRYHADRCTGWRAQALSDIFPRVLLQPLGVTKPFTIEELNEMLERNFEKYKTKERTYLMLPTLSANIALKGQMQSSKQHPT